LAGGLFVLVVILGCATVLVYVVGSTPDGSAVSSVRYSWIVGPSPARLAQGARRHIGVAVEALNDSTLPGSSRIRTYRRELELAETLMEHSLRAQPAQSRNLALLAALRWELHPPTDVTSRDEFLDIVEHAADMAPLVPKVQLDLGELLLKMNRIEAAGEFFARAIELDRSVTRTVVAALSQQLVPAEEMLGLLPDLPEVIFHLNPAFSAESNDERYLEILEEALVRWDPSQNPRLLNSFTETCLRLRQGERALRRLNEIGELDDSVAEATRLLQRGRIELALDQPDSAAVDARSVIRLQPVNPFFLERAARLLHLAGEVEEAMVAFRTALPLLARRRGTERDRARVYRQIGQAEEARSGWQEALDAYRLAVSLDPGEKFAAKRLREFDVESGVVDPAAEQDERARP